MRDDFPQATIRILADRVNSVCSNPACRAQTRGPRTADDRAVNIGVACHITAAASEGPRYDPLLRPEERRHFSNGIWLCQNCAKLIDTDVTRFTIDVLKDWKREAERSALQELGRPRGISRGKLAFVSNAKRFGAETSVRVGERVFPLAYVRSANEPDKVPTWFIGGAYVVQFKVKKRQRCKYVVLDELQVTVYGRQEIPEYQPLYAVYPAETSLYSVLIDAPTEGVTRAFSAERFYEVTGSRRCDEKRFMPLVFDNEIPHTVSLRVDAAKSGLYWVSVEAIVSRGMKQECHTIMTPNAIIYEQQE